MMKTWFNHGAVAGHFIETKERFISNTIRGLDYLKKYNFLPFDLKKTQEFIYSDVPEFEKFKNSKILVVAGGPTCNTSSWDAEDYDYIFSCNHFFLNDKVKRTKVDLCIICDEVDILGEEFLTYVKKNKTFVGFEDYNKSTLTVQKLTEHIPNRVFCGVSRMQGKIGVGPKLVILALILGANQVDFVGVDGAPKDYKQGEVSAHAFQNNKIFVCNYPYELIIDHYKVFKDYILNDIGRDAIVNNLGDGHEYNCFSKI